MYSTKVQYLVIYCMPNTWPSPYRVPRPTLFIDADSTSTCVYFINISLSVVGLKKTCAGAFPFALALVLASTAF